MIKPVTLRQIFVLLAVSVLTIIGSAQEYTLQAGDPPLAHLINVTTVDDVTVNVAGEAGAVFASAGVIVQNLYTGATETTIAAGNGSFEITISGTDRMPYQVNAIRALPQTLPDPLPGVGTIVYPDTSTLREGQPIPFGIGGQLAYGATVWFGEGRINQLNFDAGDELILTMNVRLFVPDADATLPYTMRGQIALRRLFDENGRQLSTAIGAGDDWSSELTPTGLPILGRHIPDTVIAEDTTERLFVNAETGELGFRFNFLTTIPQDLPAGLYVPVFTGQASIADSEPFDWYANRVFSTGGDNGEGDSGTILGLPIRVGNISTPRLITAVFGSPFAAEFNGTSVVDPYQISNLYQPILRPAGYSGILTIGAENRIEPTLTGWMTFLPIPITKIIRDTQNEEIISPVQLTVESHSVKLLSLPRSTFTVDELSEGYFDIRGYLEDAFGNEYRWGGSYNTISARPLTIYPAILSGTIFEVGDTFAPNILSVPTAETTRLLLFKGKIYNSCDDSQLTPDCIPLLDTVDERMAVYTALYTERNADNVQWWYGEQANVGLITSSIANGVMGLADYDRNPQAWFDTRSYPTDAPDVPAFVNFPYFQGDVVFVPDGADAGLNPVLTGGDYQYLSIVRPDVTVRQFVRDSAATFDARVSNDDLLGGQIGVGSAGNRPGDVMFLFGGTVDGDDIRGYSALAVVTNEDSARVVPPFTEPLFSIRDEPYFMFVLPTGVRPGQVLEVGNTFAHVGYVAPMVAADVYTEIITPSGEVIQNETTASPFGYFYEPSHDFTVTESGIYRVFTQASYNGLTSAGQLSRTFTGHPLGAEEYYVFVVPEGEPMLTTPRENISTIISGQTFTINVRAPEEWTDVNAYYVVRTASTILEQGTLDMFANQTNYNFEWAQISRTFPNIESAATAPSDMDEITFSFALTGLDANSNPVIRARLFTLRGNTLYTFGE